VIGQVLTTTSLDSPVSAFFLAGCIADLILASCSFFESLSKAPGQLSQQKWTLYLPTTFVLVLADASLPVMGQKLHSVSLGAFLAFLSCGEAKAAPATNNAATLSNATFRTIGNDPFLRGRSLVRPKCG